MFNAAGATSTKSETAVSAYTLASPNAAFALVVASAAATPSAANLAVDIALLYAEVIAVSLVSV